MKSFKKVLFAVLSCSLVAFVGAACNCSGNNRGDDSSNASAAQYSQESSLENSSVFESSAIESSEENESIEADESSIEGASSEVEESSEEASSEAEESSEESSSNVESSDENESSEDESSEEEGNLYTVTEEEWEAAVAMTNYTAKNVYIDEEGEQDLQIRKRADDIWFFGKYNDNGEEVPYRYVMKLSNEYFCFDEDENWNPHLTQEPCDGGDVIFMIMKGSYNEYTFDEEKHCYRLQSVLFEPPSSMNESPMILYNIEIYFEGRKMVNSKIEVSGGVLVQEFYDHNCTEVELIFPEDGGVIENEKSVLYIKNWKGPYGSKWLELAADRFEAKYAETSFEDGKTGVKVLIDNDKAPFMPEHERAQESALYFGYNVDLQDWANKGMLLDITNLVTMYNPVEYCTIENRMDEEQIQEFRINGKYYALPTYSMAQGLVYNKDLFDECGFYIAAEEDSVTGNIFVSKTNPQKSVGPDGIPDTYDDGLPVTYEEFYELCEEMVSKAVTPMAFANVERDFYMGGLFDALVANDSGAYLAETNYTMSAWTEMDLVSHFKDGNPVLEKGMIVPEIGYEAFRQVEKYNALKFMEVLRDSGSHSFYYSPSNYFWSDAQKDFIINPFIQGKYSSAMLVDGVCWHEEAKENFETTKNCYGVEEREFSFGWMPLPRSSRDKMGEPNVYLETTKGACFIKSTVSEVEQVLAKEFIRFFYTDKEMTNFTKETEAPWAMWYGSDSMEKVFQKMSFFGQSLWDFRQNASVVYARESVVGDYTLAATCGGGRYSARVGGTEYKNPIQAILTGKVNAEDYFDGMYQYNRQVWNNIEWS